MKTASMIGSLVVTIALVFYSIGFHNENKNRVINSRVLFFYTIGVSLDVTATIFMIIGSSRGIITLHGMIGYSSLLGMLTDTIMMWRYNLRKGSRSEVTRFIRIYSRIAYTWWIIAYITGGLLVAAGKILK